MTFIGYWSSPVSIPKVFDTTPCVEHMLEYEECVADIGSMYRQFLMPAWPTLYPNFQNGKQNFIYSNHIEFPNLGPGWRPLPLYDHEGLNEKQKQLLYECEEERFVYKACLRDLIKLRRTEKMRSWETAEVANVYLV